MAKVGQQRFPDACIAPAGEALVDAVPLAILLWQHAPLSASAVNPEYAFHEKAAFGLIADVDIWMCSQELDYL